QQSWIECIHGASTQSVLRTFPNFFQPADLAAWASARTVSAVCEHHSRTSDLGPFIRQLPQLADAKPQLSRSDAAGFLQHSQDPDQQLGKGYSAWRSSRKRLSSRPAQHDG